MVGRVGDESKCRASYYGGSDAVLRVLTGMRSGEQGNETVQRPTLYESRVNYC